MFLTSYSNHLNNMIMDNSDCIKYCKVNSKRTTVRGGKASNFEGGIRVNGFVSGGCLPKSRRGIKLDGLVTGWDWCKNSSPSLPASRV